MSKTANCLKKHVNKLQTGLRHPLEEITKAKRKAMGIQLNGKLKPCEDCALTKHDNIFSQI